MGFPGKCHLTNYVVYHVLVDRKLSFKYYILLRAINFVRECVGMALLFLLVFTEPVHVRYLYILYMHSTILSSFLVMIVLLGKPRQNSCTMIVSSS